MPGYQLGVAAERNTEQLVRDLQRLLIDIGDRLDGLEGRRGPIKLAADIDLGGRQIRNARFSRGEREPVTRREMRRYGIYGDTQRPLSTDRLLIASSGVRVPRAQQGGEAVSLDQVQEQVNNVSFEPQNAPPNVATASAIGSAVRLYAHEDHTHGVDTGTFTITGTGFAANPTGTARYVQVGPLVTLFIPALTGTSNAATFTLTGLPAGIAPGQTAFDLIRGEDNGALSSRFLRLNSGSTTIDLFPNIGLGNWTAAGTKSISAKYITYSLV